MVRSCLKYSTGPGAFEVVQGEEKNSSKFIMQSIQLPSYEGRFLKAFSDALRWGGHQCDQSSMMCLEIYTAFTKWSNH